MHLGRFVILSRVSVRRPRMNKGILLIILLVGFAWALEEATVEEEKVNEVVEGRAVEDEQEGRAIGLLLLKGLFKLIFAPPAKAAWAIATQIVSIIALGLMIALLKILFKNLVKPWGKALWAIVTQVVTILALSLMIGHLAKVTDWEALKCTLSGGCDDYGYETGYGTGYEDTGYDSGYTSYSDSSYAAPAASGGYSAPAATGYSAGAPSGGYKNKRSVADAPFYTHPLVQKLAARVFEAIEKYDE